MELFNQKNSAVLITNGANYFRFLELPQTDKNPVEFHNGTTLKVGNLITGIDNRKTSKGKIKGFQSIDGAAIEYYGVYIENQIDHLLFLPRKINKPRELKRFNGYYWFYYYILIDKDCLLLENRTGGFQSFEPIFKFLTKE